MAQNERQSPAAAPPDDGGHQGSYTTPEDTLEMHAADRPARSPALHRDPDRLDKARDGASPITMIAWALLFFAIIAFFMLARSC
jgi:hypothetical protein